MLRQAISLLVVAVGLSLGAAGQTPQPPKSPPPSPEKDNKPTSDDAKHPAVSEIPDPDGPVTEREYSSSTSEMQDLSPPPDDVRLHPKSAEAVREAEDAAGLLEGDELGGIQEFRPWDPHKAEKDIEVGDFYFKNKNYRAALDRYQEALYYKNNDALATFKLGVCQEELKLFDDARKSYKAYLEILPEGPFAAKAKQALARLGASPDEKEPPPPSTANAK